MHLVSHANQPGNLVSTMLLNDVNTGMCVATGTY
jgi:hypothetical protein